MFGNFAIKLFFILISCCIALSNEIEPFVKIVRRNSWLYHFVAKTKVPYAKAAASCAALGGNLVTPRTKEELEFIKKEMKSIIDEVALAREFENGYWIGLKADIRGKKPVWKWIDGTNLVDNDKNKNWIKGQPDQPRVQNCVTMIYTPNDKVFGKYRGLEFYGKWDDQRCNNEGFDIICKYKEKTTTAPAATTTTVGTTTTANLTTTADLANTFTPTATNTAASTTTFFISSYIFYFISIAIALQIK